MNRLPKPRLRSGGGAGGAGVVLGVDLVDVAGFFFAGAERFGGGGGGAAGPPTTGCRRVRFAGAGVGGAGVVGRRRPRAELEVGGGSDRPASSFATSFCCISGPGIVSAQPLQVT